MALQKNVVIDRIEILLNGTLQIRTKTEIDEDGIELSSTFSRDSRVPGSDVSTFNKRVQESMRTEYKKIATSAVR